MERNPSTWATQLSLAEFAANNSVSSSTGYSPFYLNCGEDPEVPTSLIPGKSQTLPAVTESLNRMKVALDDARTNMTVAQERTKR